MKRAAVGDSADSEQIREAQKRERLRLALLKEDYRWILSTPSGRRVMTEIFKHCFQESSTIDSNKAVYFLAKQEVGFAIKRDIELHCPEHWLSLERERLESEGLLRAEREKRSESMESEGDE